MHAFTVPTLPAPLPAAVYSTDQFNLGMCGISLILAVKDLAIHPEAAIARIEHELLLLSHVSEPDMRRVVKNALSFLTPEETLSLRLIEQRVASYLQFGKDSMDEAC